MKTLILVDFQKEWEDKNSEDYTGNLDKLNEIYAKFKNNAEDCLA